MPSQDEIDAQQLLETHRRTLARWIGQQATFGLHTPPHVFEGIDQARAEIRRIKGILRGWGVAVEDHPDDEPPDSPQGDRSAERFPRIPTCPAPNAGTLLGRDAIIGELIGRLIGGAQTLAISAVRGLPGVGKTDLLRAVGNDAQITRHFDGGVLYAELGPAPDPAQILRRWSVELGLEPPRSDDMEVLAAVVRADLRERRALLILDDVWEYSLRAARTLRDCAGPACRVLASSRSAPVAQELARGAQPLLLDVLAPDPALDLLRRYAPAVVGADETDAAALAAALGYLPLALKLAGALLANDRRRRQPCAELLATWRARLDQLRGHEQRPGLSDEQLSLDAIIGLSYAALPDDATRAAAAALAAFGATPLDFDWDALAAVWDTGEAAADAYEQALVGGGVLDFDEETRRYSLHQIVHAFLERRADPTAYERHAAYYATLMRRCHQESKHESTIDAALATLDREIEQIERGQRYAADTEASPLWDALLINYAFVCSTYFDLRGRYEQSIAWSEMGRQAAQRQGRERDAAAMREMQGIVYQATGRYDEAIAGNQEARAIYQLLNLEADTGRLLGNLGIVYEAQGRYEEANNHYQQSLEITQRIGDVTGTALALGNLGTVYAAQGHYEEALSHYQQSLEISQRIGDVIGTAITLSNLGNVYQAQGRYEEALSHYQQSLEISQRIGDLATIAGLLGKLGVVYRVQGRYEEALSHYQQSLEIRQRIGDQAGIARTSWNLGTLYEAQGDRAAALPLIEQAALIAERIGMPNAAGWRVKAEELREREGE